MPESFTDRPLLDPEFEAALHRVPKEAAALRVSLADKLHNARSILVDFHTHGDALWDRFKAGEGESVRWHNRSLADAFESRRADLGPRAEPALDELRRTVDAIDAHAASIAAS